MRKQQKDHFQRPIGDKSNAPWELEGLQNAGEGRPLC
jgi:hypothetical protein